MPTRYHLGTQAPATADAAGIMAAFATLFAVANDVDTAAAVSGVLTWTRDTTAGSQAIYSSAFGPRNSRIIIAVHDSGTPSPSPTMIASADTFTAGNILIGLADNAAGNYIAWQNSGPFYQSGGSGSTCTFAGYYRFAPSASITTIRAMMSSKDLKLQVVNSTATVQTCHWGAIVKAPSGYAESDGFRYGGVVSGVGDMTATWRSNVNIGVGLYGKNSTTNGQCHFGLYAVGGSTWQTMLYTHLYQSSGSLDAFKLDNTTLARVGIAISRSSPNYVVGTWNGFTESPQGLTGQNVNGTSDTGVRFSSSIVTTNEESGILWRTYT